MKKNVIVVAAAAIVVLVGYVAVGPFITIHQLKSAIERQDPEALASTVDFPTLRENLKEQLNAFFVSNAAIELKDNPFGALGALFASKLAESAVDALVTPPGLANLMAGRPKQAQPEQHAQQSSVRAPELLRNARYTYDGMNKFSARVSAEQGQEIRFVFTRHALSWKLSNIIIPQSAKVTTAKSAERERRSSVDVGNVSTAPQETQPVASPDEHRPGDCLQIQTFDSSVLSSNDVFTELAWKVDVSNYCPQEFSARVVFTIYDKDNFELDKDSQEVDVPASGTAKARGKMLVSPPTKAQRMAKQGASISAR